MAEEVAFDALTVVSELATNAVRHAALPRSSGEQPQRWSCSMLLCPVLPPALCDAALALPPTEGTDPTDVDRDLRCILQAHSSGDHQALVRELPA
ncbi:hypothetical protein AB0399_21170 [Streptomyces sp. NPDC088194]|uniref:hypothetical protein n=1 Tax=Streptomyces sp. NPDC088194 TaxID=3154931 RepID=UPI00344DD713